MAELRAGDWGTQEYWQHRIKDYLGRQVDPGEALSPRAAFVCADDKRVVGLVAGHLTRRFGCEGELQWISVRPEYRGRGVAAGLLRRMAEWFVAHKARSICVDVEPANHVARRFYARHGAVDLRPHWMVWKDIEFSLRSWPAD